MKKSSKVKMTQRAYQHLIAERDVLEAQLHKQQIGLNGVYKEETSATNNTVLQHENLEIRLLSERLKTVNQWIESADVIEDSGCKDRVTVGSRVKIEREIDGEKTITELILDGTNRKDPETGIQIISTTSPVGKAIHEACVGETRECNTPDGKAIKLTILNIM